MDSLQCITLTTPLIGVFVLLGIYYLIWRRRASSNKSMNDAPQPDGAWPIIGHLHLLARGDLPHITLGAMADKYGPAFMLRIGVHRAMVVSSWEIAKECFTTNDKVLSNRPTGVAMKLMGFNNSMFGFAPYGRFWREIRKIVTLEVLSSRRLESLKLVWDSEISKSLTNLHKLWESQNKAQEPVLVDMKQFLGDMVLNVSTRIIVGKQYSGASVTCSENEGRRFQKGMRDFFRLVGIFLVEDAVPFLSWLDLEGYKKEMKSTAKEVDILLQRWLDEHKEKRQSCGKEGDEDIMDVLLSVLEQSKFSDHDVDTINKSTCFALILGGSDSTGVTLTWALSLLLNNPHALKKAQDELDFHIGRDRHVDESDLKKLTYLEAIIKETMRLYPAGPLLGPREVTEDCTIAGYHVRAGTRVMVNAWKIQRDPLVWSNPCEFQPERFLNKDVDLKGHDFELIPFGSGRRGCPGISFALQVLSLSLARLLHGFELTTPMNSQVDMKQTAGLVVAMASPLEVLVAPRNSSKLYI